MKEQFQQKCEVAMSQIPNYREWEAQKDDEGKMVHEVLQAGRALFDKPLDQWSPDALIRLGGRLAGAFGYLGQMSAYARAERDVYAQKLSETEKSLTLEYLSEDKKYKVTEVRARVEGDVQELQELVIQKEAKKNQWENLLEACRTMIMFTQSALKSKEGERYQSSRTNNQENQD